MGKFNEIQEEVKQSFGSNSFTTTVKETTIEFDSAKDSFTFLDPVNIQGSLTINGEEITPAQPQVQADWNQNDETQPDYIKNRICYTDEQKNIIIEGTFTASEFSDTASGDLNPEIAYTFQIGDDTYALTLYGSTGSCGGGGYITNGTYSVQNGNGVISLTVAGDPSYYSGKNIQLYSGGVIYHKIPSEYIDLKKNQIESNVRDSSSFGNLFTIYHNKYNWSGFGDYISTLNLVVTDSMRDGNTYIFEGVFNINGPLPITENSVGIRINGESPQLYKSDTHIIISDGEDATNLQNVEFRIAYMYKYNGDNLNIRLIGHKDSE